MAAGDISGCTGGYVLRVVRCARPGAVDTRSVGRTNIERGYCDERSGDPAEDTGPPFLQENGGA